MRRNQLLSIAAGAGLGVSALTACSSPCGMNGTCGIPADWVCDEAGDSGVLDCHPPDGGIASDAGRYDASPDATTSADGGHDATTNGDAGSDAAPSVDGSDSGYDAGLQCDAGLTVCSGACVSLASSPNCGACEVICTAPTGGTTACVSEDAGYACQSSCPTGNHVCNGLCEPNSDPPGTSADPCVISPTFGVFVSPASSSSDSNPGTMSSPMHTLNAAIARAVSGGTLRVYACNAATGTFADNVAIGPSADGVSVYGGFNCASSTWTYDGTTSAAVSPASGVPLTITGLTRGVTIANVAFTAANGADGSGASSIGAFVGDAGVAPVVFTGCSITAGIGGTGASGGPVASVNYDGGVAKAGSNNRGILGGGSTTCSCLDTSLNQKSGGGSAGNGDPASPTGGNLGTATPTTGEGLTGAGGIFNVIGSSCGTGGNGSAGVPGDGGGLSSVLLPAITAGGWTQSGGVGGTGGAGDVGQGGGGGSGGISDDAGGGAGGGCGGCGGEPATGGGPGGSSIGLVIFQSTNVQLVNCTVTAHAGGKGGAGGAGQAGQLGGGSGNPSAAGCAGGTGGNGGQGGGGGGGAGGDSYGVVYSVGAGLPVSSGTTSIVPGTPGAGGAPGAGGTPATGSVGQSGLEAAF